MNYVGQQESVHKCYTQRHLAYLFCIETILILILVYILSYSLPGSGLLDPILALNFPTERDLYNLKGGEEGREKNPTVIHAEKSSSSLEDP